jgi:hypothetical protein
MAIGMIWAGLCSILVPLGLPGFRLKPAPAVLATSQPPGFAPEAFLLPRPCLTVTGELPINSTAMPKYRLRPVVVDHRMGVIAHYGATIDLRASDLHQARAEVDRLPIAPGPNCLQILNEDGLVASHRMLNSEHRWI